MAAPTIAPMGAPEDSAEETVPLVGATETAGTSDKAICVGDGAIVDG